MSWSPTATRCSSESYEQIRERCAQRREGQGEDSCMGTQRKSSGHLRTESREPGDEPGNRACSLLETAWKTLLLNEGSEGPREQALLSEIILIREGLCSGPGEQCSEVLPGLPCLKQEVLKGLMALTIHTLFHPLGTSAPSSSSQ